MTTEVGVCRPSDSLSRAAEIMWAKDCGIVPVIDQYGRAIGVLTDRDIAIAAASRDRRTSEISVFEMHFAPLKVCAIDDDVKDVLRRMRKYRIKRLCVTSDDGRLVGIISLSDILIKAGDKKSVRKLLLSTLSSIAKPAPIVLRAEPEETVVEEDDDDDEILELDHVDSFDSNDDDNDEDAIQAEAE